ncbi:MAG: hypothetical protein CMA97_00805 [Euryarchaeota archaeon]|nr:hypothetical protein [Euryarchaeota archaeon]
MIPDDAIDRLLEGCQVIAKQCEAQGIQEWEIVASQGYGRSLDIEAGRISLASGGGEGGFGVRVLQDGRYGYAHLVDPSGAEHAVSEASSIAKASPKIEGFTLPNATKAGTVKGMSDDAILSLSAEDLLMQGDDIISEVASLDKRAVVIGGGVGIGAEANVMLSSEGVEASGITTSHGLGVQVSIEENGQMTSSWESCSSRQLMEGIPSCVPMAVEWAQKTRDPISVETQPVDTPLLMTPQGISSLFSNIIRPSILGERMVRKESFWSEKMNELVLDSHLTMLDNRRLEGGFASSTRDGEGVPTSCHTIVENGVLKKMIWSTRDAAKNVAEGRIDAASTTGSASRGSHMSPPTTGCGDVQLLSSMKSQTRDELIETMDNGYIVHSVMGAHTANPTSGDFSVTTSTILKVENGEIQGALKQAGVSGNLFKAISTGVQLGIPSTENGVSSTGSNHLSDILFSQGMRINPA